MRIVSTTFWIRIINLFDKAALDKYRICDAQLVREAIYLSFLNLDRVQIYSVVRLICIGLSVQSFFCSLLCMSLSPKVRFVSAIFSLSAAAYLSSFLFVYPCILSSVMESCITSGSRK